MPIPNGASRSSCSATSWPRLSPPTTASIASVRTRSRLAERRAGVVDEGARGRRPGGRPRSRGRRRRGGRRSGAGARRRHRGRRAGRSPGCCGPSPCPCPSSSIPIRIAGTQWRSASREATIPTTPGCQPSPASTSAGRTASSAGSCGARRSAALSTSPLGVAALVVGAVELGRDRRGPLLVVGEHQLDPGVGAVEAARGVDPRGRGGRRGRPRRAARARRRPRRTAPAAPAGVPGGPPRGRARTSARFSPRSGTRSATVASATRSRSRSPPRSPPQQRRRELVGDPRRAELGERVAATGAGEGSGSRAAARPAGGGR